MSGVLAPEKRPNASNPRLKESRKGSFGLGDTIFKGLTLFFALSIFAIAVAIAWQLWKNSVLPRHAFGWSFLVTKIWDPVQENYGALPFIFGTLVSSAIGLLIAVPLGVG